MKRLHNEKIKNKLYHNCLCSLTFKPKGGNVVVRKGKAYKGKRSYSTTNIYNKSSSSLSSQRTNANSQHNNVKRSSCLTQHSNSSNVSLDSYQHIHWENIRVKAGVISTGSPYLPDVEYVKLQNKENRKKWICPSNFNVYVGKATTNKSHIIKNYVGQTPSQPPVLYNFRTVQKKKWMNEQGFKLF